MTYIVTKYSHTSLGLMHLLHCGNIQELFVFLILHVKGLLYVIYELCFINLKEVSKLISIDGIHLEL